MAKATGLWEIEEINISEALHLSQRQENLYRYSPTMKTNNITIAVQPFYFERTFTPDFVRYFFGNYWHYSIYMCVIYLMTIKILQHHMKGRPPYNLKVAFTIWNGLLATYSVNIKGSSVPSSYPVNRWNCTYPCYYDEDDSRECRKLCLRLGGEHGYCYWFACYCENLPESVKQIKHQGMFGCSNGRHCYEPMISNVFTIRIWYDVSSSTARDVKLATNEKRFFFYEATLYSRTMQLSTQKPVETIEEKTIGKYRYIQIKKADLLNSDSLIKIKSAFVLKYGGNSGKDLRQLRVHRENFTSRSPSDFQASVLVIETLQVLESSALNILNTATGRIANSIVIEHAENVHVGNNNINKRQPSSSTDKDNSESFQIQKESLMYYYNTKNAYMKSLLWSEKSKDLPVKDYFIKLTVQEADLLGKKAGEAIQFTQIFPKSVDEHVVILVTGDPGYGKTTFCKKIAYDWGTDTSCSDYLRHYDFTVVITLRELEKKSISDEILQRICGDTDSNSRKKLRQRGFNLLILLDGFDETDEKDSIIQFITKDSFHISKEMTILVTCRPYAAENIREYGHMRFTIQGFSQQQKEKYIKLIINDDKGKRDELLNLIKFSNFYCALAECPLMLHMLCCLPQSKYFYKIHTRTDLFIQIFRLLTKRYKRKLGEKHDLIKGKFFYGEDLLVKLGKIYVDVRSEMSKTDKPVFMYEMLKLPTLKDKQLKKQFTEEKDYQFILGLDIFGKYSEVDGISYFDFIHRSFFDFIMALCYYHSMQTARDIPYDFTILTFLSGLYGDEEFSNEYIHTIQENIHSVPIWLECVNEIKNITNKQLFCSMQKYILIIPL
ncbi:uncharacterized protein [Centruroides vittatus]|uniref:uncharacterized protein n=1 Tax=Centruroides vittatus TaxID=120091 RepID=UPI00350F5B8F